MRVVIAFLALAFAGASAGDTPGRVQGDPRVACEGAKPHELCFAKPTDGIARAEYLSEPFYAVILKTAARCTIPEKERAEAQALFPAHKVFSMRFYCDENVEEAISYTNVNDQFAFLAVHAGASKADGNKMLKAVRTTGRFPGANVRKMRAKLIFP